MNTINYIQLNAAKSKKVAALLQQLLADFQIYYTNLRGFHWNVKGEAFFALHSKFEELYDDAAEKVDEIAERILMLGETPENKFSTYLKVSKIEEVGALSDAKTIISKILDNLKVLIAEERSILEHASDGGDESTVALMSDYLREQEKLVWMLVASQTK